jgi:hypothetical protein
MEKGWITVDPNGVIEVVSQYGNFQNVQEALRETFTAEEAGTFLKIVTQLPR